MIVEVNCGQPIDIRNADLNAPSSLFGDVAVYTCFDGFETADNSSTQNITCQANKAWTNVPICSSK